MTGTPVHYEIKGLRFDEHGSEKMCVAVARGDANYLGKTYRFELKLKPLENGEWQGISLGWIGVPTPIFQTDEFVRKLVNTAARTLDIVNMWPSEQEENAARISMNQKVVLSEADEQLIVSFRSGMLSVPSASWEHLWDLIERRVRYDKQFRVLGFDNETVLRLLPLISTVFPDSWARARYRSAGLPGIGDQLEPTKDGWFPAYHLARTAHAAICRDPGWNYLVEIGLSLEELKEFDGLDRLQRQVTKSPGTQHHLCLAAELHSRGILVGLERSTGVGSATNDLVVCYEGEEYQVEVKQFTSKNPEKRLKAEIEDKNKKLPSQPEHAVVFHIVLSEDGFFDPEKEKLFFEAVGQMADELPESISAVVAGRRFVDSRGGRIKRDVQVVVVNPKALKPVREEALRTIFAPNYSRMHLPMYGIGSFFVFETGPPRAMSK